MLRKMFMVIALFTLVGCATTSTGPQPVNVNKAVIDGQAIYVGQSKASVEAALGAPDRVDVVDPKQNVWMVILEDEMKARGDWYVRIYWIYNRGGKKYTIHFKEGMDSVQYIQEVAL